MRIVCPACEAEYEVPDTLLANGQRKVRCARCAREWEPFAPPPPPPPVVPIGPGAAFETEKPAPPPRAGGAPTLADYVPPIAPPRERPSMRVPGGPPSVGVVIAWLVTGAAVIAAIGVLWLKRPEIVHAWPPAGRLFKLFGLDF